MQSGSQTPELEKDETPLLEETEWTKSRRFW